MSKEHALGDSRVTALIVEPLSKRAQLLSSSILTQAMFSGPHQQASGSGFKKGVFHDVLMLKASHLGMPTEQQLASEVLSLPSLPSPLSCLNTLSGQICYEVIRAPTPEAVLVLFWYSSTTSANEWYTQQSDPSSYSSWYSTSLSAEGIISPSPFCFTLEISSASSFLMVTAQVAKV